MTKNKDNISAETDVYELLSTSGGIQGLYESGLRKFYTAFGLMTLIPFYLLVSLCLGLAAMPALAWLNWCYLMASSIAPLSTNPDMLFSNLGFISILGISLAISFFIFGTALLLVVPFVNFVIRVQPKPYRGPYYSIATIRWGFHNALTYLARYTFLRFATPTPLNIMFYRLMGMKVGNKTVINTTNISDPGLIEMGDKVTIGGSATIFAHYGSRGYLVISPVKIHDRATIGQMAIIMGGTEIGENARVLANSFVLPNTKIPAGENWGGVPAKQIQ